MLTFVEDHGLIENCDAAGCGDSGIYPGAGAEAARSGTRGRARVPLHPGHTRLRLAPQHGRLLRHRRQRHPRSTTTTSTTTRWASRPTSSRRPGTPASRRTPTSSRTTTSTTTTSTPTARQRRPAVHRRCRSARACGSRAATTTSSAATTSTTTGAAAVMLFAVPGRHRLRADGHPDHGVRRVEDVDLVPQPVLRQHHGHVARRRGLAQRAGLLVGLLPGHDRQLLVQQHAGDRQPAQQRAGVAAGLQRRQGPRAEHGHRLDERDGAPRLPGGLRRSSGYPAGNGTLCNWTTTPPKPGDSSRCRADGATAAALRVRLGLPERPRPPGSASPTTTTCRCSTT